MSTKQRLYRQKPDTPPAFLINEAISEQEVYALRAIEDGTADAYQQRLALRCIVTKISGAYDQEFVIGSADQSAFRGGRSFVGKTLIKLLKTDLDVLLGDEQ